MFTDLEGSTGLVRRLGDEYGGVRSLVAETFSRSNRVGEAVMYSFERLLTITDDPPRYANKRGELPLVEASISRSRQSRCDIYLL